MAPKDVTFHLSDALRCETWRQRSHAAAPMHSLGVGGHYGLGRSTEQDPPVVGLDLARLAWSVLLFQAEEVADSVTSRSASLNSISEI
jgi:hypothetical protein